MIKLMSQTENAGTSQSWTIRLKGGWSKKIILLTVHSVIATILFAVPVSAANAVNLPGKPSEIKSPSGLYTIKNVDLPDKSKRPVATDEDQHFQF